MKYHDGSTVALGDIVNVPVPDGTAKARVVMLGDTYEHLDIEAGFLEWVKADRVLKEESVVVEWVGSNPFAHNDPQYAPVGNYMFTATDECVTKDT
jgi:hypothetical protein